MWQAHPTAAHRGLSSLSWTTVLTTGRYQQGGWISVRSCSSKVTYCRPMVASIRCNPHSWKVRRNQEYCWGRAPGVLHDGPTLRSTPRGLLTVPCSPKSTRSDSQRASDKALLEELLTIYPDHILGISDEKKLPKSKWYKICSWRLQYSEVSKRGWLADRGGLVRGNPPSAGAFGALSVANPFSKPLKYFGRHNPRPFSGALKATLGSLSNSRPLWANLGYSKPL